jgi:hypothetical protein
VYAEPKLPGRVSTSKAKSAAVLNPSQIGDAGEEESQFDMQKIHAQAITLKMHGNYE